MAYRDDAVGVDAWDDGGGDGVVGVRVLVLLVLTWDDDCGSGCDGLVGGLDLDLDLDRGCWDGLGDRRVVVWVLMVNGAVDGREMERVHLAYCCDHGHGCYDSMVLLGSGSVLPVVG